MSSTNLKFSIKSDIIIKDKNYRKEVPYMYSLEQIKFNLMPLYNKYANLKIGVAGSYINGTQTEDSDIDVVLDGDSTNIEIMEEIKQLFNVTVDVLWLDLLKEEDEEMDSFCKEMNIPINEDSVYKTILKEVEWI